MRHAAVLLLGATLSLGCSTGPTMVSIKGKVTLDGKVVERGAVQFYPVDGKSPTGRGGEIINGAYSAQVARGEMRVEITAPKVIGKRKVYNAPESPYLEDVVELIPAKYHGKDSILKVEVKSGEDLDFDLKSK